MNMKLQLKITMVLVLVGFVTLAAGCAKKTGVEQAQKTTASMETVNSDTKEASLQIDATNATLQDLLKTGQNPAAQPDDVKAAHERFSANVASMNYVGKKLNKDIDDMHEQGNAYFLEWAKEGGTYTNPQMQKLSEEQRSKLDRTFREMQSAASAVRPNLNSYLADIKQIQTYLSNDLTPKGIAAIAPIANRATEEGAKLKRSFIPVQDRIMEARAQLTPGGAAAGGVSGTTQQPAEQKKPEPAVPGGVK